MGQQSRESIGASVGAFEPWVTVENAYVAKYDGARSLGSRSRGALNNAAALETRPEALAAEVCNSIFWDLAVPRDRVRADCEAGWVTLTGEVERPYQRSAAEADVLRVPGVLGVTNAIIVGASGAGRAAGARDA